MDNIQREPLESKNEQIHVEDLPQEAQEKVVETVTDVENIVPTTEAEARAKELIENVGNGIPLDTKEASRIISEQSSNPTEPVLERPFTVTINVPYFIKDYDIKELDIALLACEKNFPCLLKTIKSNKLIYDAAKLMLLMGITTSLELPCRAGKGIGRGFSSASRGVSSAARGVSRGLSSGMAYTKNIMTPRQYRSQNLLEQDNNQTKKKWYNIFGGRHKITRKNAKKNKKVRRKKH